MQSTSKYDGYGTAIASMLTFLFIVLKLIGTITWSWFWVLSPIWLSILLLILIFALIGILYVYKRKLEAEKD